MPKVKLAVAAGATVLAVLSGCTDDQSVYPDPERNLTEEEVESLVAPPDGDLYPDSEPGEQEPVPEGNVVNPSDEPEEQQ